MTQVEKSLPCKQENLRWVSKIHIKNVGTVVHACNPNNVWVGVGGWWRQEDSLTQLTD